MTRNPRCLIWENLTKTSISFGCFRFGPDVSFSTDKESEEKKIINFLSSGAWTDYSARFRAVSSDVFTELSIRLHWQDFSTHLDRSTAADATSFSGGENGGASKVS